MSKDKRWIIQNDPGILRKKADAETDLFVFGYACKIFRDDQKALEMDQGKHLIPWMGDETLKVDRYDARGHLSEISQFEGTNQDYVLTPEERRIEQLCDEERYRALHHNEEEQEMYQEEELKRLKQALSSDKEYGQVAYQYEAESPSTPKAEMEDVNAEDGEPFVPSPSLYVPANMKLPSTVKENQIIEKTAVHIASHGPQVEILIKTRQANNQKLNFLHVGSPLNPYYNFILSQIKMGRYKPAFMIQQESESNQENEHYLHPSLAPAPSSVESAPSIPSIAYKPSSDCSYNMLVNKIRNVQQSQGDSEAAAEEPSTSEESIPSRRKRRKIHAAQSPSTSAVKQIAVPPEHVKEIISRLINFAHSRDLHPSEIATNLLKQDSKNLGFVEPGHKYHDYYVEQVQETYKENIYNLSNPSMEMADCEDASTFNPLGAYDPTRPMEEELDHSASENADSPLLQEPSDVVMTSVDRDPSVAANEDDAPNPPSKPAPVCFSIKKPKEAERLEHVSAFPLEESSSDEEGKEMKDTSVPPLEGDKEKVTEMDKLQILSKQFSEELAKPPKEKERSVKNNRQSPAHANPVEVIVISSSQSSDSSRKTISTDSNSRRSITSSNSRTSTITSTTTDSSRKIITPSRKVAVSSESQKNRLRDRAKRSHRKHKYSSSSTSPEKYIRQERAKMKAMGQKSFQETIMKIRRISDDLPPLPEDPSSLPTVPGENIEKKREERKKKVKEMIEKIKTESFGLKDENSQTTLLGGSGPPSAEGSVSLSTSLSQGIAALAFKRKNNKSEEKKVDSQKDFEEQLREQVKQSLKKIAETTLAAIPPITEDSGSQFEHSSAANSNNGFETPSSCGRPMYRVSRTPSVGLVETALQENSSSRSSSTITSRKSHKKKKHRKKRKKRKGRSKTKKHQESSSDSSSDEESSDEWASSSDSDTKPKKRHRKSSKRSYKRYKRKHRQRDTSSSASSSE